MTVIADTASLWWGFMALLMYLVVCSAVVLWLDWLLFGRNGEEDDDEL